VGALDALAVERIDHGVQSEKDAALMQHLVERGIPLTVPAVQPEAVRGG
jgi:adenosine deaminase